MSTSVTWAAEDHAHHFVLSVPPTLTADVPPGTGGTKGGTGGMEVARVARP